MVVISVDVPEKVADKIWNNDVITINKLYDYDEDISSWNSVKVWEKASNVLDFLKKIK